MVLVYKSAVSGMKRVLITMDVGHNVRTNFARRGIHDPAHAWYRVEHAMVLAIEDDAGLPYETATSAFCIDNPLTYSVNHVVIESDWDPDIEAVNTRGIHVFFSKDQASMYGKRALDNGVYRNWYPNGQLCEETPFRNGLRHGLHCAWTYYGMKILEVPFETNRMNGRGREWSENGTLVEETEYVDDNIVTRKRWSCDGILMEDFKTNIIEVV